MFTYDFIIPIFIVWFLVWLVVLLVYYSPLGDKRLPVLNRVFVIRSVSITLFVVALVMFISGTMQLLKIDGSLLGKPLRYWHALTGYLFLLLIVLHLTHHIKDVYRYIIRPRPPKNNIQEN